MTSSMVITQYEQFGRDWMSKEGPKWQGKDIDKATEVLTATIGKRAKDHINDVGTDLLKGFGADERTVATAGAGLISFDGILVGAFMNRAFINKVLLGFALQDQANIDKLNEDLKKICKPDNVAQKVKKEDLKETAEETFKESLNCSAEELAQFLPIMGHMYNVGSGSYKIYAACWKTIIKIMTLAEGVHCQIFIPLALRREVGGKESVISALEENCKVQPVVKCYRVPHCVRCFLGHTGDTNGNRTVYCQSCISQRPEAEIPESWDFRPCHWKNHGKQEDNENVERLHDERWCTIRLIKAAKKKKAWECIPCFFMFGRHKPEKCILNAGEQICEFCELKGHHAAACGKRFFHAYSFIMKAKDSSMDIGPLIAEKKFITDSRTEAFRNVQRYKFRTAGMSYGMSYLPQAMTRENTECVLLGSVMLDKNGMRGPNKMTKDEITKMTSFEYQTHVNLSKDCIKPGLFV